MPISPNTTPSAARPMATSFGSFSAFGACTGSAWAVTQNSGWWHDFRLAKLRDVPPIIFAMDKSRHWAKPLLVAFFSRSSDTSSHIARHDPGACERRKERMDKTQIAVMAGLLALGAFLRLLSPAAAETVYANKCAAGYYFSYSGDVAGDAPRHHQPEDGQLLRLATVHFPELALRRPWPGRSRRPRVRAMAAFSEPGRSSATLRRRTRAAARRLRGAGQGRRAAKSG